MKKMEFNEAVEIILKHEGGYVNDPTDLGGETKYGICKRAYPNVDIKNLTLDEAKAIYKRDYWDKAKTDEIAPALRLIHFDTAVNMGVGRAAQFLQTALGVTVDGVLGVKTLEAAKNIGSPNILGKYTSARLSFYNRIVAKQPAQGKFLLGWYNRVIDIIKH